MSDRFLDSDLINIVQHSMKNTTYILFVLIVLLNTSCLDKLNIEPEQAILVEVALSSEEGVKSALVGAYSLWGKENNFSGNILLNSEMLIDSENLIWTNSYFSQTAIFNKQIPTDSPPVENFWIDSYALIDQTNIILSSLDVIKESDPNTVAAEAHFLRALVYFDLVNLFGKTWGDGNPAENLGVPIVTMPSEQNLKNPLIPRNTVADVFELIQEDLQFAKTYLLSENGIYANTFAASALLSRMYLMQEEYELARLEADRVINSGYYLLVPTYSEIFNASNNTPEDIFSFQRTPQDRSNSIVAAYSGRSEGGVSFLGISEEHLSKYEMEDQRRTLFYLDGTMRTGKWRINSTNDGNITYIRLGEMYLTRAEARFQTGDLKGATEDLNVIRKRAGLSAIEESDITLEIILNERFLELAFEGHQFRDSKRNKRSVGDLTFDDAKLIYPIPKRELDLNKELIQNEGY